MNITLIGYRGTGKSTVARSLAGRLGWKWVDADNYIEEQAGQSIREIFEREGEAGFRDREAAAFRELSGQSECVIAAGGGVVLRAENRAALKRSGFTVWLTADPEVIDRRIAADPVTAERRPPLTRHSALEEIRAVLREREPMYGSCADVRVETDSRTPDEVADQVLTAWRAFRGSGPGNANSPHPVPPSQGGREED